MKTFKINGRPIGPEYPTYIIAELSANHGQSLEHAKDIIRAIKEAGADAIKLQTYTPDTMTIDCDRDEFVIGAGSIWEGKKLYDLYGEAQTPWEWHAELFQLAEDLGMDSFSTPFDTTAVDYLETLNPPAYKVASFELIDLPLVEYIASKGRPMIMSTGMASLAEISEAVEITRKADIPLILLKCTSAYPSPPGEMNLRTIPNLSETFNVPVGLSDHTLGIAVPIAAVALGARVVEKHVTLSRSISGPDSKFSLEPSEFKTMVRSIRETEMALGRIRYSLTKNEQTNRCFRRSLYAVKDIGEGETFTEKNIRSIRPGFGLHPKHFHSVMGKQARQSIPRGTPLQWNLIA